MSTSKGLDPAKQKDWESELLTSRFNTHKPVDEIHPDAAVNIYVGWPTFFDQIKYHCEFLGTKSCNILDFGCGAGNFCKQLNLLGHKVVGIDRSHSLLKIARDNSPKEIEYINESLPEEKSVTIHFEDKMDVITSIHAFDWIEDIESTIKELSSFLKKDGVLIFSIFPKAHVIDSLRKNDLFEDFDSKENPTKGFCNFDGVRIPVYIRDPNYFDNLFKKLNFEKLLEYYPPFPKAFFDRYSWPGSKEPEMLILGYRKL